VQEALPAQFHGLQRRGIMPPRNVVHSVRKPGLFSPEINRKWPSPREIPSTTSYATIRAFAVCSDFECRKDLKRALCELLLSERGGLKGGIFFILNHQKGFLAAIDSHVQECVAVPFGACRATTFK